jgi:pimeloyl-ACP methyl ester carboxylesterase
MNCLNKWISFTCLTAFVILGCQVNFGETMDKGSAAMEQLGNLHIQKVGQGKNSVILLPGLGCDYSIYDNLKETLKREYTLYLVTVAGFGGTRPGASPVINSTLSSLRLLIKSKNLIRPVVIGHSIGGAIVLKLASLHPDLLGGVVILDAAPRQLSGESQEERRKANRDVAAEMFNEPDFTRADSKTNRWISEMVMEGKNVGLLAAAWERADRATLKEFFVEGRMLSFDLNVKAITVPICVIAPYESGGEREQVLQQFKQAYVGAPSAEIKLVGHARHFVMLDQPQATNEIILGWLRRAAD